MQASYVTEEHCDYKQSRATGEQFQTSSEPRVLGKANTRSKFRTDAQANWPRTMTPTPNRSNPDPGRRRMGTPAKPIINPTVAGRVSFSRKAR